MRLLLVILVALGCGNRRDEAGAPTVPVVRPVAELALPTMEVTRAIADAACPTVAAPYFYRIEKQGKTSHILGTRHLGVDVAKLPAVVTDQIAAASVAVFETAPDDDGVAGSPAAHGELDDQLGPQLWQRYERLVGAEVADAVLDDEPATALIMLIALFEDRTSALDLQLEQLAQARAIPVLGLETAAFQDGLIRKWLDLRALGAALKVTADRAELKQSTIDDLTEYCAGTDDDPGPDPEDRREMIESGYTEAEIAQYEEDLLFSRNRDWLPKLVPILARGNAFIAVGADHLIGTRGVVALLAAQGYRVTRVTPP